MARNLTDWLEAYMVYTAELESPDNYHLWCGISAIAGALRRNVLFNMGYFKVYPNLYVVLVGPPGRTKKSTAMRASQDILHQVPGVNFASDSTSRERLILDLSTSTNPDGYSAMSAYSSEFASMLTTSEMNMVSFLTDIYDSPKVWEHKTKQGVSKIRAPCMNLIAGTTPMWISSAMPIQTIGIGLASRIIFVFADKPRLANPFPELSEAQVALERLLAEDLAEISSIRGAYTYTPEAREAYISWYTDHQQAMEVGVLDPRLSGYFERKPVHFHKVCMAVAASRRNETEMTLEDYVTTHKLLAAVEADMPRVFANVGKNPLNNSIEAVTQMLMSHEAGLTKADLLSSIKHDVNREQLDEILDILVTIRQVKVLPNGHYQWQDV